MSLSDPRIGSQIGEYNVDAQRIAMRPVFCRVILSGYLEDVP